LPAIAEAVPAEKETHHTSSGHMCLISSSFSNLSLPIHNVHLWGASQPKWIKNGREITTRMNARLETKNMGIVRSETEHKQFQAGVTKNNKRSWDADALV
jgi:hypothetical protein